MKLIDTINTFVPGDWGNDSFSKETSYEVSCIRGADIIPISNSEYQNIPSRYISKRAFETKCLKVGDIVIEKSGGSPIQSTGRVTFISKELIEAVGRPIVCSNFCVAFRVNKEWNPLYVYYYIRNIYNYDIFFNFEGKTSGIKNLQLETAFRAIPIKKISIDKQNEIANTLLSIDRKIALNLSINQNLEAMAKQLYDYWFVQFEFPDENGKPYKSSGGKMVWNEKLKRKIPKGWIVEAVGNILDKYPATKKYETKEYLSKGVFPIIDQGEAYIVGFTNEEDNLLSRFPAVLFGDHSTRVKFINFTFARGADGTQILYSKHPNISQYYLYLTVLSLQIPNPGYSRHFKYLKEMSIVIPASQIAIEFQSIISQTFSKWTDNIFINIELIKLRDELLPLLMNGQVSVNSDLSAH